jgi:hypothetical protein
LINPNSGRKLEVRGSQEEGFFVDNLFATYIETMDEILTILQEGELNRATAAHLLNEHSSRSHAILTIQVENELQNSQDPKEQITKLGKLIFVDLAGSEKVKITQSKGKNLTETNNINKSLLVLGKKRTNQSETVRLADKYNTIYLGLLTILAIINEKALAYLPSVIRTNEPATYHIEIPS